MEFDITTDPEEGGFLYQGANFNTITDALISGMMGFCGCGQPWPVVQIIADILYATRERFKESFDESSYDQFEEFKKSVFGENDGLQFLVWYIFDHCDLMDHGSSLPGWLTPKGDAYLSNYEKFKDIFLEELES